MDAFAQFVVVVNHEEQHALWPSELNTPEGWHVVFGAAPKEECLGYVQKNWPDIRPKSLRDRLHAQREEP